MDSIIVVTPARNESKYLPVLFESLSKQTVKPNLWLIVDDGSTDLTPRLAQDYAGENSWIEVRTREDRGRYYRGKGVAESFMFGVAQANDIFPDWNLLAKIDADTDPPPSYFLDISKKFSANRKLGIASGFNIGEKGILTHPRGNNRVYRRKCWEAIGGLPLISGWDTWDETMARAKGWSTASFKEISVRHLRPEAATFSYSYQQGRISHFLGYTSYFAIGRSVKISYTRNPICGLGYLLGYFAEKGRIRDEEFTRLLRAEQGSRLRRKLLPFGPPAKITD
jgi:glycosyltransferase involved in cell wall biosynthesis